MIHWSSFSVQMVSDCVPSEIDVAAYVLIGGAKQISMQWRIQRNQCPVVKSVEHLLFIYGMK